MGLLKIYNADEVTVVFGPVLVESGRGPDEFVRIENESNAAEDDAGVDGEVTVSRSKDKRATVTLTLMQTSASNDLLSVIANALRSAPSGAGGIHPLLIQDQNGRALYTAANAWILKEPDVAKGKSVGTNEWPIRCAELIRVDGGS